jgi:ABC-type molybdate transport system substrate-binding protein
MRNRLFLRAVLIVLLLQAALVWCQQLTIQTGSGKQVVLARADIEPLPRIEQVCVVLSSSKNKETERRFLLFVKTAAVADILRSYGFDVQAGAAS